MSTGKAENTPGEEMVECLYQGASIFIPLKLFLSMTFRTQVNEKKYVRYKEGSRLYSMSEREFNKLAHDANAVYKLNKMALVRLDLVDRYLEYFK